MSGQTARSQEKLTSVRDSSGLRGSNHQSENFGFAADARSKIESSNDRDSYSRESVPWDEQELANWRIIGSIASEQSEADVIRSQIFHFFKMNQKKRKNYDRFLKHDFDFIRKITTDFNLNLRALNSLLGEK